MATVVRLSRRLSLFSRHFRGVTRSYNSWRSDSEVKQWKNSTGLLAAVSIVLLVGYKCSKSNVVHAKSRKREDEAQKAVKLTMRERRFIKFASVEYDGQLYMTPQDFLDSIIEAEPRPRLKRRVLADKELEVMRNSIPSLRQGNPHMFRNLRDKGIISYTEYLFLLSILIKPKSGFHIAFNMFDTDGNGRVDKTEFLVIRRLLTVSGNLKNRELDDETERALNSIITPNREVNFKRKLRNNHEEIKEQEIVSRSYMEKVFSHAWRGRHGTETKEKLDLLTERQTTPEEIQVQYIDDDQGLQRRHAVDTSLMIHFFGKDGNNELKYEDFKRFMENLQQEVLELEFHEFSKGRDTISELDFAKILLRYTQLVTDECDKYLDRILQNPDLQTGIGFEEFRRFYQFLNNLDDFAIAMRMYTLADHPISKDEFQRAVKICTGSILSNHIIDTVFALFDDDGDGQLSYQEFIAIMKDRLRRGFKSQQRHKRFQAFTSCVKQEMKSR
ncbi:calcium uptake protein 3, mitochondrial isoform X1 [Osmia bicornis bicornis]|uniref:calcium uptake protein 3, mitochondrial isoform X1 n=1 Tax=Osmia bicornis bicornis TaxID=1437191 RepID=UPI0010F483F4|nr:calcium uptake protein 3, mitochondrial isoform X1 [Osmia bicornis bicornis]